MTPTQLAAGSTFAVLLPASTSSAAAAPALAGQPCSTGATACSVGGSQRQFSPQTSAARTPPHLIVPPTQQQDAWHSFQRRSLDGGVKTDDSTGDGRSGGRFGAAAAAAAAPASSQPLAGAFADGFESSPRPRQRRSLDTNRLSLCTSRMQGFTNDPSPRASLDGGAGRRGEGTAQAAGQHATRGGFSAAALPPASAAAAAAEVGTMLFGRPLRQPAGHPAAGDATGSASVKGSSSGGSGDIVMAPAVSSAFSNAFATAGARVSPPASSPAAGGSSASSGSRIVSGRGYNPAFEATATAPPSAAPSHDGSAATNAGGNGGTTSVDAGSSSLAGPGADTPQLLALATQALNVLAMHQQRVAPVSS